MDLPVVVADEVVVEKVFGVEHREAGDADLEGALDGFVDQRLSRYRAKLGPRKHTRGIPWNLAGWIRRLRDFRGCGKPPFTSHKRHKTDQGCRGTPVNFV